MRTEQLTQPLHKLRAKIAQAPVILYKLTVPNNNEKFRSFKSKENIHKKEVGPYRGFGY